MWRKYIVRGVLTLGIAALSGGAISPAAAGANFSAAVERILMSQDQGPVSKLPTDRKRQLISCVNQVLAELPNGKKRFVIEAASYDELQSRFGQVVNENHAEWKQRIARGCAHLAV
jgi:hypothetical protein